MRCKFKTESSSSNLVKGAPRKRFTTHRLVGYRSLPFPRPVQAGSMFWTSEFPDNNDVHFMTCMILNERLLVGRRRPRFGRD
jgi:hypothetical protein